MNVNLIPYAQSSPTDQFQFQLQQVQPPQQFQAMISQMTGQPAGPAQPDQPVASGGGAPTTPTTPTAKHCQGGGAHHTSAPSPKQPSASTTQNQSLLASMFG
jgi:hypothetical protein